jgi:hypothetical protein
MRASTKRNGTGCGKTSVDKIATGPVGLLDTVVGQWLVLGQKALYQFEVTTEPRFASRRTQLATSRGAKPQDRMFRLVGDPAPSDGQTIFNLHTNTPGTKLAVGEP